MPPFAAGHVYHRVKDIHEMYAGQRYGGISTPTKHPYIFLFTGESGVSHGYRDEYRPDGSFWYTGEGQVGDMQMAGGNAAIRDHAANRKTLHLFEYVATGQVRYLGEAHYLGHHVEERPDREGETRNAIVFELAIETDPNAPETSGAPPADTSERGLRLWSRSLDEVRTLALQRPPPTAPSTVRRQVTHQRSVAVRVYVLRRADGICEGCRQPAPFKNRQGRPYLEPHHIYRLADGGPDHPSFVAALCPTCHRRIHHGRDGDEYNGQVADYVRSLEADK